MTPDGMQPGQQIGLMRGDETIVDTATGQSSIPSGANPNVVGTNRDVIPVGEPGRFTRGGTFDRSSILGNKVDMETGRTFLEEAWGPAKLREQLKFSTRLNQAKAMAVQQQAQSAQEENKNHKHRNAATKNFVYKQIQTMAGNALNKLNAKIAQNQQVDAQIGNYMLDLAARQDEQYGGTADENGQIAASCGKNPRYTRGKIWQGRGLTPAAGLAVTLPYLIRESNFAANNQPVRQYSFVSNPNANSAVDALSKLRYDNSADYLDLLRTERRGLYGIKQAGNLSTGQRRALANNLVTSLFDKRAALRQQAQQLNNQYAAAAAQASMQAGQDYASRLQQARQKSNEDFARALGAKQQLWAANNKNWYTGLMGNIRDWDTQMWRNRLLDMYDADIASKSNVNVPKKEVPEKETPTVATTIPPYLDRNPQNWPAPEASATTAPFVWDWNNLIPPTITDYSNFKLTDLINR